MIDGLGVVGWGVGGIEAEGVMLGQPIYMLLPEVVGMELTGQLSPGATATDLVLTVTEILRREKVVGKFVEFFGPGVSTMAVADRATIGNMSPEYGATMGFFPVDEQTLRYLAPNRPHQGRKSSWSSDTPRSKACSAPTRAPVPTFTKVVRLDLSTVEPSLAGPKRPQDRVALSNMKPAWREALATVYRQTVQSNNGSPEGRWEGEGGHKIEPKVGGPCHARRHARRSGFQRRADRIGRQAIPTQARRRGDRRHHELHEHEQSQRDGRRRPARQESRGKRPHRAAAREDEPRARLARRHRLLRKGRPRPATWKRSASTPSATAARRASATAARCRSRSRRP